MKLNDAIKNEIRKEYDEWFNSLYGSTSKEERKKLGAVFTPPEVTIQMIERMNYDILENIVIIDPCCGAGNLIAACLIAGADPKNVYGNEFEQQFVDIARKRLKKFNVSKYHIHQGDATNPLCLDIDKFNSKYNYEDIKRLQNTSKKINNKTSNEKDLWNI